jgi:hypothetical protein
MLLSVATATLAITGCMKGPVNGLELSSRKTPFGLDIVIPQQWASPMMSIRYYDDADGPNGGDCCTLLNPVPFTTDSAGTAWVEDKVSPDWVAQALGPGNWIPNHDPTHPNAKWKLRYRLYVSQHFPNNTSTSAALSMFAGNPDGTYTASTQNCIVQNSGSGYNIQQRCSTTTMGEIYAIGD